LHLVFAYIFPLTLENLELFGMGFLWSWRKYIKAVEPSEISLEKSDPHKNTLTGVFVSLIKCSNNYFCLPAFEFAST